jgi:hypothetical protein
VTVVQAELNRRDILGNLVPWLLNTDGTDPVADAAVLAKLEVLRAQIAAGVLVAGIVALDATTLAALENVSAIVSGTVALDSTTLAALENITATIAGPVTIANPTTNPETGLAKETTLHAKFGPAAGTPTTVSGTAAVDVYTPTAGLRSRIKWVGISALASNTAPVDVLIKWSGASGNAYHWSFVEGSGFAHGFIREGAVDEKLQAVCSVAGQSVYVNIDAESF